ncbi:Predicted Zn-dependent peptidase [Sphingopyxis sp. YR583]|uniref:M16 family metallopeptidase n=1 Tax=Sphingopyxis sp. YR583 TaxID=1881047 RepID=UPI0008A7C667|nr:insulinase family protein [Sphingopyxis sp. YR583]SEH12993.1 Predicted Zn-dependent peptidase [Sphingopyxis sp. YR583]
MKRILMLSTAIVVFGVTSPLLHSQMTQDSKVHEENAIDQFRSGNLENGFGYIIQRNNNPKGRIELRLVVRAGMKNEAPDQIEAAHLVEHIVANHVAADVKKSVWEWVPSWGGQTGVDFNAETHWDRTVYILSIPSDRPDLLREALQIQRGWAQGAKLSRDGDARERKAVSAELLRFEDAEARLFDRYAPQLVGSGHLSTLEQRLNSMASENTAAALRFYDEWYQPQNQALIVVGDLDPKILESEVRKIFSDMVSNEMKGFVPSNVAVRPGRRVHLAVQPGIEVPLLNLISLKNFENTSGEKSLRNSFIIAILDRMIVMRSGILGFDTLNGMPHGIKEVGSTSMVALTGDTKGIRVSIPTREKKKTDASIDLQFGIRKSIIDYGFSESEFDEAREYLLKSLASDQRSLSPAVVRNLISEWMMGMPAMDSEARNQIKHNILRSITVDEVSQIAREWLRSPAEDIILTGASKADLAKISDAKKLLARGRAVPSRRYSSPVPVADLKVKVAVPEYRGSPNVEYFEGSGVTRVLIPENGISVIFRPAQYPRMGKGYVLMTALRRFGTNDVPTEDFLAASVGSDVLWRTAPGLTPVDDWRLLAEKNIWAANRVGADKTEMLSGGPQADIETLMKIFYSHFQLDREGRLKSFPDRQKYMAQSTEDWISPTDEKFSKEIEAETKFEFVERGMPTADQIRSLTFEQAYRMFDHFYGPTGEFVFAVTGDYDIDQVMPYVVRYIAALPGRRSLSDKEGLKHTLRPGALTKTVYLAEPGKARVFLYINGNGTAVQESDKVQVRGLNLILSQRLRDRIREKEQGTYSVIAQSRVMRNGEYSTYVDFQCADENFDRLMDAAVEEIERLVEEGPTDSEITAAAKIEKDYFRQQSRGDNYFWANYFMNRFFDYKGNNSAFDFPVYLAPTRIGVHEKAKELLRSENLKRFIMRPVDQKPAG